MTPTDPRTGKPSPKATLHTPFYVEAGAFVPQLRTHGVVNGLVVWGIGPAPSGRNTAGEEDDDKDTIPGLDLPSAGYEFIVAKMHGELMKASKMPQN